ncbi:MAG: uL22 family ribosomal protein [Candidatus Pacearchaeota archaeon]|jgi:ribosomal protein L22
MTEKQYAPTKLEKKSQKISGNVAKAEAPIKKNENKITEEKIVEDKTIKNIEKTEDKKTEIKKTTPKIKKNFAIVNSNNVPISTKYAMAICKFIKNKPIQKAINELEEVTKLKKAVPMKGEIPHRKGKMMSGRYPVRASTYFIKILKGLLGNAHQNEISEPIIKEAIANKGQQPYGRFGAVRKKRTHLKIVAYEKTFLKNKKIKKTEGKK